MAGLPSFDASQVLLVDDDKEACLLLRDYLEAHNFALTFAHTGRDGLESLRGNTFDLVLLDMFLPDMNGVEVLRHIRAETSVPVVILSAHNEETDRIVTLELGADDYVPKSFSSRELLAHIRAVQRRYLTGTGEGEPPVEDAGVLHLRDLELDDKTKEACLAGVPVDLTASEFRLLFTMTAETGRVFSREELLGIITGRDFSIYDRSVDAHISSLRQKLGDDPRHPRYIRTLRGVGYTIIR